MKETADFLRDFIGTFEEREMPAIAQHDEAGTRYCLSDVGRTLHWDEIMISVHDQRGDVESCELREQIVYAR